MKINEIIKDREQLGKYLRNKRELLNVTKSRLRRFSGLKYDTIRYIENGSNDYTITSLLRYWISLKKIKSLKKTK